jgi:hypothetical protein
MAEDAPTPTTTSIEGIPPRETVVTFREHFASYNAGESAAFTPDEAQKLVDDGVGVLGGGPSDPPINIDVPFASQDGNTVNCTMGNWTGTPTAYDYQWKNDGADVGGGSASYTVTAADVGHTITCIVSATNDFGTTAAPPSNGVVIVEPAGDAAPAAARHAPAHAARHATTGRRTR